MKFLKIIFLSIIITFSLNNNLFAWEGFDTKTNDQIEIGGGVLVREGMVIDFFDSSDGNYHNARVISMFTVLGGVELIIEDYTRNGEVRNLLMKE